MKLFKRILISLFPEDVINQPINPASMFVSFISSKQFFSVVNRKIVENYKLNLFDISLDSFDVKVWFGNQTKLKQKESDFYYAYWVVANFNWYRFFSPSNIWSVVSLVCSIYMKDKFRNYDPKFYINFILTIYFLTFVFASRIKVFPYSNDKENYKWFIDLFFNFYYYTCISSKHYVDYEKDIKPLKNYLLKEIQVFFMLFYFYKKINKIFYVENENEQDFYNWIFQDEINKKNNAKLYKEFINNYYLYSRSYFLTETDKKIIKWVLPVDVLLRYLFDEQDCFKVVELIIQEIYEKNVLDDYLASFLKSDEKLEEFLHYITDYKHFKNNYFVGIKKFITQKFKTSTDYTSEEELDELMSAIWEVEDMENIKIPDKLKKESAATEKLINFYLTFVGWFWIARWDSFFHRIFRKNLIQQLSWWKNLDWNKQDSIFFYGSLLYNYSKNVFYYRSAFENVKSWKERFKLPYKSDYKQIRSNSFLLKLFDQNFVSILLQDICTKDIKLYIQNKDILNNFKKRFGKQVSNFVKLSDEKVIEKTYQYLFQLAGNNKKSLYSTEFTSADISTIKENIYSFDLWLWLDFLKLLKEQKPNLTQWYSSQSIMGIFALIRESLFGFLLYYKYLELKEEEKEINLKLNILKQIYIYDVIWITEEYFYIFEFVINQLLSKYNDLLTKWVDIDDNAGYFQIWFQNWKIFVKEKDENSILSDVVWEDIIWFRWFLKNITYYNKRYLIPKD